MQQLQEEKKEIIEHSARKIVLIYEAGKTSLTAEDEELLNIYRRLHDFEVQMLATASKLFNEFIPVSKKLAGLNEELIKVQAAFDECSLMADKLSATNYNTDEVSLEMLAKTQEQTGRELLAYSDKVMKVYKRIKSLSKELTKYNTSNEEEVETLYTAYSKISTDHSINWKDNAINIAAFMDEYAQFESYRSINEERRDNLIDFCNTTVNNYSTLTLKSNSLYNVWKEFSKRYELLKVSADLHASAVGFTNN